MKRKSLYFAGAWAMGLIVSAFVPISKTFIIIPVVLILFLIMKFLFGFHFKEVITVMAVFVMATGIYRIYELYVYKPLIEYNNEEITFNGKICDIKEYKGDKAGYTVKGKINGKEKAKVVVYADLYNYRVNDYFKFYGTVTLPENDYLFNSKDFYKSKGIYLVSDELKYYEISPNNNFSVKRILKKYTDYVTDFINRNLPEESGTILSAMIFGDTSLISADDKTLLYRTGIGHVMAVSGQHLVIFCGIFTFFLDRIRIGRVKKFIFLEIMIAAFSICSGLSPSVLRSAFMMTIVNAAPLFVRRADTLNSIGISFVILTAVNPFSVKDPSLILSVTGTFGAGVFAPFLTDKMRDDTIIRKALKYTAYMFVVSVSVLPFSIMFFGESSFISPIVNIILTPICLGALLLVLIAAMIIFVKPVFLIEIAGFLCEVVLRIVRYIGAFNFSGMNFGKEMKYISSLAVIICITGFMIYKSRKVLLIILSTCMISAFLFVSVNSIILADKVNIAVLGDKSADVIVISKNDNARVIDLSGRKKNCKYALKYLQENNINKLEGITIKTNPLQAISAYNNGFALVNAGSIIIPDDTVIRSDMKICGYVPQFTDFENLNLDFDGIKININKSRIYIEYGEFEFVCDNGCNDRDAIVYAEYGEEVFNPPAAKAVIVPGYENTCEFENVVTDRNIHIIADKKGNFKIGGL